MLPTADTSTRSRRQLRAMDAAHATCHALRDLLNKRNCDVTSDDWNKVLKPLTRWMANKRKSQ